MNQNRLYKLEIMLIESKDPMSLYFQTIEKNTAKLNSIHIFIYYFEFYFFNLRVYLSDGP